MASKTISPLKVAPVKSEKHSILEEVEIT